MKGVIILVLKFNIPPPGGGGILDFSTNIITPFISALLYSNVNMLTLPSGTGKYTAHGPHYAALGSHYAALGPRPNGLWPSGGIMGP